MTVVNDDDDDQRNEAIVFVDHDNVAESEASMITCRTAFEEMTMNTLSPQIEVTELDCNGEQNQPTEESTDVILTEPQQQHSQPHTSVDSTMASSSGMQHTSFSPRHHQSLTRQRITRTTVLSAAELEHYKLMHKAAKRFAMNAELGIGYLAEHGYFNSEGEPSEEEIAAFLLAERDMLSKRAIGEYLGEAKEKNIRVLDHFIRLQSFKDTPFDKALRQFLVTFRLPGEAQKIDRIMERFAGHYVNSNPDHPLFQNDADTAYILAFSTIMLNTDLHNPAVKNKIPKATFVRNNSNLMGQQQRSSNDSDNSKSLEFLESLYECIKAEPLAIVGDKAEDDRLLHDNTFFTFFNPEREGYLYKQGGRIKTWKKRYCILTGSCLYYFKSEPTTDDIGTTTAFSAADSINRPCGIVPLENLSVECFQEFTLAGDRFYFRLVPNAPPTTTAAGRSSSSSRQIIKAAKTGPDGKLMEGRHTSYLFYCDSEDEQLDWVQSIQAQMARPPLYTLYQARKRKQKRKMADKSDNCDDKSYYNNETLR